MILEVKNHKSNKEVNLFYSKNSKSHYHNIIDRDPNKLAQVIEDLHFEGYPMEKACKQFLERLEKFKRKDWLGLDIV